MKAKHYFLISLFLIILIMIPASFAANEDVTNEEFGLKSTLAANEDVTNEELGLKSNDINLIGLSYNEIEDKGISNNDLENDIADSKIEDTANENAILLDSKIEDTANENAISLDSKIEDTINENAISNDNKEKLDSPNDENAYALKGDIYTEYSNYINLSSDILIHDFKLNESNTIYLNSSYTGNTELGSQSNPFKTIDSAYDAFIENENFKNLFIANGIYTISSPIRINRNITIIGENSINTILRGNDDRIFIIAPPINSINERITVNLINLTFANGKSCYGGAIWISQSDVNIANCIFKNNSAIDYADENSICHASGGAIYNDKGLIKICNCLFEENRVSGGNESFAGAIYNDMGEMTILNSKFISNYINGSFANGGAIYDFSGVLVIYNTTISNNTVNSTGGGNSMGGGICTWASHNVFIINSSIEGNKLYGFYTFGSAISNNAFLLEIHNTTISNNDADGISYNSKISNNEANEINHNPTTSSNEANEINYNTPISGYETNGSIFNLNGNLNLENITFRDNSIHEIEEDLLICLEDQIIISKAFDDESLIDLPSSYDLRDYGWVSPVRDQGKSDSCWTFTTMAVLESYLLKNENISYDLSENNLKNLMSKYGPNGTDWDTHDGGNVYMALAYLLRWSGPVNESDDPFNETGGSSPTDINPIKHIQDVLFIPVRLNYLDLNQIKYAIMTYGALYTSIYADDLFQIRPDYCNNIIAVNNHAVTLVGWDDNYPASNFHSNPPGDGAFIIKNSWGENEGYDGYWYISYYDKSFASFGLETISAMAITNLEDAINYQDIYQYDTLGNTYESLGFNSNTAWMANQFTAVNDNPLAAFGLYTFGNSEYFVNITVNGISKHIQEGIIKGAGYHTINLEKEIELNEGDIFKIAVRLTTPDSNFPIAIESQRNGYSSKASANIGESFVSIDGENWIDLAEYKNTDKNGLQIVKFYQYSYGYLLKEANVCLKAYSSGLANLHFSADSNASSFRKGDIIEMNIKVSNSGGSAKNINISINIDDSLIIESISPAESIDSNGEWILDSLNKGETAMLKIVFRASEGKETLPISFNCTCDGGELFYHANEKDFIINYEGKSRFLDIGNISTLSKSEEDFPITLVDFNSNPVINRHIIVSLIKKDGLDLAEGDLNFEPLSLLTNNSGIANFILNLTEGNYTFLALFEGDENYTSSNASFNISVSKRNKPNIDLTDNSDRDCLEVILTDANGMALANKTLNFSLSLNGEEISSATAITDRKGKAKYMGLDKLEKGAYVMNVFFSDDYYNEAKLHIDINIKNSPSEEGDNDKSGQGETDSASNGNSDSGNSGNNMNNMNNMNNWNGGNKAQNTAGKSSAKKASKLYIGKKTFKLNQKVKKLSATLKSGKKAIKGKKIIFIVNGKKYIGKTNKKGIATVKIKLAKRKTYKATAKFTGDKYYKGIKKSFKVVVK